jgi:hypothetical protein
MRCWRKRRVRRMGDVRLESISAVMLEGVLVEGSRTKKNFWMPAFMKTVSRVGWELRIAETRLGIVLKPVLSHSIC